MKIRSIEICSLGVYSNIQLDFGDDPSGLIFINGNNGRGKTTLINSLKWCLFSGSRPPVAESTTRVKGTRDPILVSVAIELLGKDGVSLLVEKSQLVSVSDDLKRETSVGQPTMQGKLRIPGQPTKDLQDVQSYLDLWLPKRLEDFILFDAEQLANFFNTGTRVAVETAVLELAGVDNLDEVLEALRSQKIVAERAVAKSSGASAETHQKDVERLETLVSELETALTQSKQAAEQASADLAQVERDLTRFDILRERLDKEKELRSDVEIKSKELSGENARFISELVKKSHLFMAGDCLLEVEKFYNQGLAAGYPLSYPTEVLRELLESEECICGCNLDSTNHRENILRLIERQKIAEGVDQSLPQTRNQTMGIISTIHATRNFLVSTNRHISSLGQDIQSLERELEDIDNSLATPDEWQSKLDLERKLRARQKSEQEKARKYDSELYVQRTKLDGARRELLKASKTSSDSGKFRRQIEFLKICIETAVRVRQQAIQNVRQSLEDSMNSQYANIKAGTYRVTISDRFEVRLENADAQTVSEGEKMSLAYAFAIAIRDSLHMELPLVVDSAFGRLSSDNRYWLSKALVDLVSKDSSRQAVFLMHDIEYNPQTRKVFQASTPLELYMDHNPQQKTTTILQGIDPAWLSAEESPWFGWAEEQK